MSDFGLLFYGIVSFTVSILSGAIGGGAGFILTPLLIFLGLSPAQAVANGKPGGLAVTVGSLAGLRGHKVSDRKLMLILIVFAVIIGLITPKLILSINPRVYEKLLGLILILFSPFIVYKKFGNGTKSISSLRRVAGLIAILISMFLVAIFSGGIAIFINVAMISILGMDSLDATVTKRISQFIANSLIIIGLLSSGLFIARVLIVAIITHMFGGFIGGKLALKKGSEFVSRLIAVVAFFSGLVLVLK